MKDFISQYKRKNIISHLSLIAVSFVFAFSLFLSTKDTDVTQKLKGDIIESVNNTSEKADIYITTGDNNSSLLISGKDLTGVKSLSFSLSYNPEGITNPEVTPLIPGCNIEVISNTPGYVTYFMLFDQSTDIGSGNSLAQIFTQKKSNNTHFINILQTNYTDINGTNTFLSTSGIDL